MTRFWPGIIEHYRERLPVTTATPVITLFEGGTPLVPAPELSRRTGCEVSLKVEGANPTGSFKDRGMTMAISKAAQAGAKAVICASTGNTSASAAAYAVRAGMTCAVLVPQGKIALGKMAQALVHGARLLQVDGNFDDCLELARKLAIDYPVALVNSVNPDRIEGQKTAAFEICDVLGRAPDVHCIPVGNAGNITAYWKGYREYALDGVVGATPRMFGFQAAGAAPIVLGAPVLKPMTIATAIRIGNPASWDIRRSSARRIRWTDRRRHRQADPGGLPVAGPHRGRLRRAGVRGLRRRVAHDSRRRPDPGRLDGGVHADGQRPQRSGLGDLGSPEADHRAGRQSRRRVTSRAGLTWLGRRFEPERSTFAFRPPAPTSVPASTLSALPWTGTTTCWRVSARTA